MCDLAVHPASAATFSWPGFFVNAAAITTTLAFLGVTIAAIEVILRRWPRFRRRVLSAPLRVATRRGRRPDWLEPGDLDVLREEFGGIRRFRHLVTDRIFQKENELSAGFMLADLLAAQPRESARHDSLPGQSAAVGSSGAASPAARGEHHWTRLAPVFFRVFSAAARQRSTRLIARILYPEDVRTYSALFGDIARAVRQLAVSAPVDFDRYRPSVGEKIDEKNEERTGFASFVTSFSGSVVLADAAESASCCAEQVLVWHSRRFRGLTTAKSGRADGPRYGDTHGSGVGCEKWGDSPRRIGDFDQRVLHLRSVALAEATAENGLSIVLETSETCYGVSELGAEEMGCKNVTARLTQGADADDPVFRRRSERAEGGGDLGGSDYRIARQSPDAGRVTLLTAQLALITADDKLVLQDRTDSVRHDASLIGASAGGVISLGGIVPSGDLDSTGWPDPVAAVIREAREEAGVDVAAASCRPVCVYLLNVMGNPRKGNGPPQDGQLGAAILFTARTSLDSGEVEKAAKTQADQARGRFERSGLRWCPAESPGGIAGWMRENAARLSIHALMACTYSSLVIFGRTATEAALSSAFADRPWWAISPYSPPVPRLVRDPRCLMEPGCIDEAGPPAWAAAWESLDAGRRRRAPAW